MPISKEIPVLSDIYDNNPIPGSFMTTEGLIAAMLYARGVPLKSLMTALTERNRLRTVYFFEDKPTCLSLYRSLRHGSGEVIGDYSDLYRAFDTLSAMAKADREPIIKAVYGD